MPFPMLISAQELLNTLNTNDHSLKIFDCRFDLNQPHAGEQAFSQGHIPNAHYIHLEKDLAGPKNRLLGRHPLPTPQAWQATCESLFIQNNTRIIVYDDLDNSFSSRLWWMLHATGYDRIQLLDGGLAAWVARESLRPEVLGSGVDREIALARLLSPGGRFEVVRPSARGTGCLS